MRRAGLKEKWASMDSTVALPVTALIRQSEREADVRARELNPRPTSEQIATLASRWGARVRVKST